MTWITKICFIFVVCVSTVGVSWSDGGPSYRGLIIRDVEQVTDLANKNKDYREAINRSVYGKIARIYNLDPLLLYSISLIASEKSVKDGVMPWPYTLTIKGKKTFYENEGQARKALKEALSKGEKNIAIGLMQVNLAYHRYSLPEMLLEPFFNIAEGARLLKKAISSTENYHEGIGRYFTWSAIWSEKWGKKVLSQYKLLVY